MTAAAASLHEDIKWWPQIRIEKWEAETLRELKNEFNLTREPNGLVLAHLKENYGAEPTRVLEAEGNALVTVGLQRVSDLLTGTGQAFTTTRGMTGVGDSATAYNAAQTALVANGSNALYKAIDSAPGSSNGVITCQSTYQLSEANWVWNEWCLAVATASPVTSATFNTATTTGVMLNRKVQGLGTKVNTAVWVLQVTVTQA